MKATLVGISKAEGKSKATGNPYSGYFLYYCSAGDERVVGMKAADTFVDEDLMKPVMHAVGNDMTKLVNKKLVLDFNARGRLEGIDLLA